MGTPAFAAESLSAVLDAGHHVVAAVTRPDAHAGRGLKPRPPAVKVVSAHRGVPILQPEALESPGFLESVEALAPEVLVVVAFGRLLKPPLLDMAPRGAINVHASLLPKLRGASPIVWAIARGERETGVTTMRLARRLDAGDILLQRSTPIGEHETAGELERRLAVMGGELLVKTLEALEQGRLTSTPQDERLATWAPSLRKDDGVIDWGMPAAEIACRVRAFDPWPAARTRINPPKGIGLRLFMAQVADLPARGTRPGEILDPPGLVVACGDGTALAVGEVQPEGRRRMKASEALSGRYLKPGDLLGGR